MITAPGRYRPACLIHQTGTCSVASPRAARRNVSFWSWGKSLGLDGKKQKPGFSKSLFSAFMKQLCIKWRRLLCYSQREKGQNNTNRAQLQFGSRLKYPKEIRTIATLLCTSNFILVANKSKSLFLLTPICSIILTNFTKLDCGTNWSKLIQIIALTCLQQ